MRVSDFEMIFRALNRAGAEYLVVGGAAVIAHGHMRMTNDLDLVLNLSSSRLPDAMEALRSVGLRPRAPVDIAGFADSATRESWRSEKQMVVFNLLHPDNPAMVVDVFVSEPFDFAFEYARAKFQQLAPDVSVPIVSLDRLIAMKREVGRPQDLIDVEKLDTLKSIIDEQQ